MVDKVQLLGTLAETALTAASSSEVLLNLHPVRLMLTSQVAKIASYSLLIVAAGYTTGVLFEKVFPNVPKFKRNVLGIRKRAIEKTNTCAKSSTTSNSTRATSENAPEQPAEPEPIEEGVPLFKLPTISGLWTTACLLAQPLRNTLHM